MFRKKIVYTLAIAVFAVALSLCIYAVYVGNNPDINAFNVTKTTEQPNGDIEIKRPVHPVKPGGGKPVKDSSGGSNACCSDSCSCSEGCDCSDSCGCPNGICPDYSCSDGCSADCPTLPDTDNPNTPDVDKPISPDGDCNCADGYFALLVKLNGEYAEKLCEKTAQYREQLEQAKLEIYGIEYEQLSQQILAAVERMREIEESNRDAFSEKTSQILSDARAEIETLLAAYNSEKTALDKACGGAPTIRIPSERIFNPRRIPFGGNVFPNR